MSGMHRITHAAVRGLASADFAPDIGELLVEAQYSKRLLLLRAVLDEAPPARRNRVAEYWAVLEQAERRDPAAVRRLLACPSVGVWAARRLHGGSPDGPAGWDYLGRLALAAMLRTGVGHALELPLERGSLLSVPSLGELVTGAARRLVVRPGPDGPVPWLDRPGRGPARWLCARALPLGTPRPVLLDDQDPLRDPGLLPVGGERPVVRRLTDAEAVHWSRTLSAAVRLLRAWHPPRAAEVDLLLSTVVPVVHPTRRTELSATLSCAFGQVLASRPRDPLRAAGMLVHELQHAKLYALADLVTLYEGDTAPRFRAPWRPGGRPFEAFVQGLYAHVALAEFWAVTAARPQARDDGTAAVERDRCRSMVLTSARQLDGLDGLTGAGSVFVSTLLERVARLERGDAGPGPGDHAVEAIGAITGSMVEPWSDNGVDAVSLR